MTAQVETVTGIIRTRELGPLPRGDYRRLLVPGEPGERETRRMLLEAVTVDDKGVAHGLSSNGTETMLAAVMINDAGQANLAPLELGHDVDAEPLVQFALPTDTPSRVGFFLGWGNSDSELYAAIRAGLYPGVPLLTLGGTFWPPLEDELGLTGIKAGNETQEDAWAEQVRLFTDLGFNPKRSRGIFDRRHRVSPYTSSFDEQQPLSITPQVDNPQGSTLQVLFYTDVHHPRHVDTLSLEGAFRVVATPQG